MKFSAADAQEASEEGEPIFCSVASVRNIIRKHVNFTPDADPVTGQAAETDRMFAAFVADTGSAPQYDAWAVLLWLGY